MKKQFKTLLAILLLFVVLPVVCASAEPTKGDASFQRSVLNELGILEPTQEAETVITRGDWAMILYRLHQKEGNWETPEPGVQTFDDVDRYHYLSGYLAYLKQEGIICGDSNHAYRPEDVLCGTDFYHTLMCMLGYQRYMQETDAYITRVQNAVSMSGIKAGLMGKTEITYGEAVPVLYDFLFCKMMQRDLTNSEQIRHEAGGEYIRERMGLDYAEGKVEGVGTVYLCDIPVGAHEIVINQQEYTYLGDMQQAEMLFGYRVLAFVNRAGEIVVACPYPSEKITILSEDVLGYENKVYTVAEGKREKRLRLSDSCMILYNGQPAEHAIMQPDYGEVILTDADEDGYFDTVFVYEKQIAYIREKSAETGMLYTQTADGAVKNISLDSYQKIRILDDGEIIGLNAMPVNTVALFSESEDGGFLQIEVLSGRISGTIEAEGEEFLTLDGAEYKKATRLMREGICGLRSEVEVVRDTYGRIVYLQAKNGTQWQFGYVISAWEEDTGEYVGMEILDATGTIRKVPCAQKVTMDGERYTSVKALYQAIKTEAIVRFVQKGDVITKLDYGDACYFGGKKAVTENNKLLKRLHGSSLLGPSQTFKLYSDQFMPGEAMLSPGAVIFTINIQKTKKEDRYGVTYLSAMPTDTHYWIEGYNMDPDAILTDVLLVHDYDGSVKHGLPLFLVSSLNTVYDEQADEVAYEVEGLYNGAMISYRLKEEALCYVRGNTKLSCGDSIYITGLDTKGRITGYALLYSYHNREYSEAVDYAFSNNSTYFSDYKRIFYGNPVRLEGDALQVRAMYGINYTEVFRVGSIPVYVYEAKTNRVRIGMKEEMSPSDVAVVKTSYSIPQTMVLYKN